MDCPVCKVGLKNKEVGDVAIDQCPDCGGTWYMQDELREAKDSASHDLNWMDFEIWKHEDQFRTDVRGLACPSCEKQLVSLEYGNTGVTIDYCPDCKGVWLDEGEFEKIVHKLSEEANSKSVPEYIRESVKEAGEIVSGPESFLSEWKDFTTVLRLLEYRMLAEHKKLFDSILALQKLNPFR